MKKLIALLLSLLLVASSFTALFPVTVLADGDDEEDLDFEGTPEDAWEGGHTAYKGKDGSITTVYDNGSVKTEYPDGTKTGVDYKGNEYHQEKDGTQTVRTTDGYTAKEYPDGRHSLTEPDGKTTTVNKDGSLSESYKIGLTIDYNQEGTITGIGFSDSDKRIPADENGYYQNGEISGPDGQYLKITDDGLEYTNKEGTEYRHTDLGGSTSTSIKWKDGAQCQSTTTTTYQNGAKTENTDFTLTESDGSRWDSNLNTSYDADGNPVTINNHVTQWTGADGSTLWMDNNSDAVEFKGKDGLTFVTDKNGNLKEYSGDGNEWNVTYDDEGNVTSAIIKYPDGATMIKNPDGTASFNLPDGTKYTSDGNGNVYKNGIQVKKDGKWLPGYDPESDGYVQSEEVVGTWSLSVTMSNIKSPLIDMIKEFIDSIFGEGTSDDVVDQVETTTSTQTAVISSLGGDDLRVVLSADDVTMVYEGELDENVLRLKLISQSSEDDEGIDLEVKKLELTFARQGENVYIDGSYHIDTFWLEADYYAFGTR